MNKNKLFYIFIMLLPLIDLITSITTRVNANLLSLGMLIKGLLIIVFISYILFKSKSKYRKMSLIYLFLIFLYILGYFAFKIDNLTLPNIKLEIIYLLKFCFFPISFVGLINYFDDHYFDDKALKKALIFNLILYIILIIGPTILNINFKSYTNANYLGSVGWYYSANEISTILLLLLPFIYTILEKNIILFSFLFLLALYMISLIGTKVTLFGIIIITFLIMLLVILKRKVIKKQTRLIIILSFIVTFVFMINNYSAVNMRNLVSNEEQQIIDEIDTKLNNKYKDNQLFLKIKKIGHRLLSDRDIYALNTYDIYKDNFTIDYLFYGMGFSNTTRINNYTIEKAIEIDFLDIFFHMGLIALVLLSIPFIFMFIKLIKLKNKTIKFNSTIFFYIMIILMTWGISSVAGHVYFAPAVTFYIALYFIYLFKEMQLFNLPLINKNKIAILTLHLGYGGIENVVTSIASYLSKDYEVEIVSLYKNPREPYFLPKEVKVNYLMNTISNRQEFIKAVKSWQIKNILKEGFKAIKILVNKNRVLQNYLINSDAQIIISTRLKFSALVNRFGNNKAIKIHQEHSYSVSKNYITKLNKLNNFKYVISISKALDKVYTKSLKIKVKYIPLALKNYPLKNNLAKLVNKNIVAIGRLEKEKGFSDLLKVMKELHNQDAEIKLTLIGDGSLKEELIALTKDYCLTKTVHILGYQRPEEIAKIFKDSSLFVLTSLEESFGLVVLEAMSYGIPCIIFSSAQGTLEMIDKNNGYVIKNRDINQMAYKITNYFKNTPAKRRVMGNFARLKSEAYNEKKVKKIWLDFMAQIIKEKTI